MRNRYVIMARENYPGAQIREVCRCDSNPKDLRNALADYTVTGALGTRIHKFNHVEILTISRQRTDAQMKNPGKNVKPRPEMLANLLCVFSQIDTIRADSDGKPAAQGAAPQERAPLQIGQPESRKP